MPALKRGAIVSLGIRALHMSVLGPYTACIGAFVHSVYSGFKQRVEGPYTALQSLNVTMPQSTFVALS